MNSIDKIYVTGHQGMVGSAIVRRLEQDNFSNILKRASKDLDLRNQADVIRYITDEKPDYVFMAAAKVGGILANNTYRAEFLYDNLMIEANIIHASYLAGVRKLLFLGSSCIYPRLSPQPIKEEYLLTGELESTNEPYSIAKIAGIKLCDTYRAQYGCNYISAMPTNLYGPNDNYDLKASHVLPALIRKFHEAKKKNEKDVVMWGTGSPMREFMHVDDLADACVFLMQKYDEGEIVNLGTGEEVSILELAVIIKEIVGFEGEIIHDRTKPDGMPRKLLDVSKLNNLGWQHSIHLREGIRSVYASLSEKDWY